MTDAWFTAKRRYEERDCGYETACWVWTGCISKFGYGRAGVFGSNRTQMAHRIFWERDNGPVPAGLDLDHLCRNRACVNPDHLEPVTRAENLGRSGLTGKRKLTIEQVNEIRQSDTHWSVFAQRLGVSKTTIYDIRRGKTWKFHPEVAA